MGFTTAAFIKRNTPELRKKLEELGYIKNSPIWTDNCSIIWAYQYPVKGFDTPDYVIADSFDIPFDKHSRLCGKFIDCGTNEELFLAIAALRDDTDENQWFVTDSPLSVSYDDAVGNDHYFTEPKGSVFFWDINWMHATIISGNYHKATVEELIEHFKGKGESMSNDFLGDMDRIGTDAYKQGEEDAKKRAIEILASVLENWVHGGDADCIIAEFEEELMKK